MTAGTTLGVTERTGFFFFLPHMDYQGSSEEKQLLLFPILQFPLCTERKENGKKMERDSVPNRNRKQS